MPWLPLDDGTYIRLRFNLVYMRYAILLSLRSIGVVLVPTVDRLMICEAEVHIGYVLLLYLQATIRVGDLDLVKSPT